jgi:hypothetical protein
MQLNAARLCLDCEEVHEQRTCPVCSSESFAYISRWIPTPEPRTRVPPPETRETTDVYRQLLGTASAPDGSTPGTRRWLARGVLGLAAVGIAGWAWNRKPAAITPVAPDRSKTSETTHKAK